jgi:stage V sporulation protein D (sporulation-specific penicillin-binding protein)
MSDRPNKKNPQHNDINNKRMRKKRSSDQNHQVFNSSRNNFDYNESSNQQINKLNNNDRMSSRKNNKKTNFLKQNINIHKDVNTTYKNTGNSYRQNKLHANAAGNSSHKQSNGNNSKVKRVPYRIRVNRIGIVIISTLILFVIIYLSTVLYDFQINKHDEMSKLANDQYYRKIKTPPRRGDIYDRNGKILATTTNIYRIGITPKHVYSLINTQTENEIAQSIAGVLNLEADTVKAELQKKDQTYIQLAKNVSQEKAELLDQYLSINKIGGVRLDAEPERVFFNDNVGSQIIGFSSLNGDVLEGRLGIEYELDSILSGQAGFSFGARDNYANAGLLPFSESTEKSTKDGYNVTLTLDYEITKQLQDYLERTLISLEAKNAGMGLIMNVQTGEILALASYPFFSSSDPTAKVTGIKYKEEWDPTGQETINYLMEDVWRNKAVSDLFEVGSTFKMITTAMGIEENITHEEKYYNDDPIDVLDYTISCFTGDGHGTETLEEAFTRSCNPPFVQIALDVGIEKFYKYVDAFGFNQTSGIQLPAEAKNLIHKDPSLIDLATLSFGEQSGFNLVSYSKGLAAVVNGGNLITPTIIKSISDQQGRTVKTYEPQIERRVISESTSQRINKMLQKNDVMQGFNKVSTGYSLGGKTSTSVDEITDELTMSYVSFAPIDNPQIMTIIVAQNIGKQDSFSTDLINPVSGLTNWVLDYLNIGRNYTDNQLQIMQETVAMPDIYGQTLEEATYNLNYDSIIVKPGVKDMKPDDQIMAFVPEIGTALHNGSTIFVYPQAEIAEDLVAVPDFTGKNFNECMLAAESAGIVVQFEGDFAGLAVSQSIPQSGDIKIKDPDQTDSDIIDQVGTDSEIQDPDQTILSATETETDTASEPEIDEVTEEIIENNQGEEKMTDEDQNVNYVQRGSVIKVVLGSASSE